MTTPNLCGKEPKLLVINLLDNFGAKHNVAFTCAEAAMV